MNIVKLIEKGEDALKKKNFDYAIEILLQAVSFSPNNRRAREALRKAELKKYEHAYPSAGLLAIFGLPARLGMFFSGMSKKSNPEGFMMACEKYLAKDPKNRKVNMALGEAAALGGHIDSAIFALETAAEHHPGEVTALKQLGHLLWKNGEINKAHATFDKVVKLAPHDQDAVKARKNLAAEASLKETGFETARTSRDLVRDKDAAGKLEQESRMHQTTDDLATQRARLEEKLAEDQENVELLQDLAELAQRQRDWDGAESALKRAIAARPDDGQLEFALGDMKMNRYEEEILQHVRDGSPDKADAARAALRELKAEEFARRIRAYPTDLNLRFKLGSVLFELERTDEAIAEFQQTVRDPKYRAESQLRLGKAFARKGQYDLAIRQLEQALEGQTGISERVKEIRYQLGSIYEAKGDLAQATSQFGMIYEADISYEDVAARLRNLESGEDASTLSLED